MKISLPAARALLLAAQGLSEQPARPAEKGDLLAAIRRMGVLQIDSISVVARSHELVPWSRLGDYPPSWLGELLAEGAIFESWAHAACFIPVEDYPLYRRRMLDGSTRRRDWLAAHPEVVGRVLAHIRERGGARASDFERTDGRASGWWDWKPEKQALEHLYSTGDLMIARREGFQRVYDLRERVLPDWDDAHAPSAEAVSRALAVRAVRALGVARARWVHDYFRVPKGGIDALLAGLAAAGDLLRVRVAGWDEPAYIHPDNRALAEAAGAGRPHPARTTLLSPFDPVVWDRARARELFGFVYRIETYTPAVQRRYGYFTLPILHDGALVGRLDPKLERRAGRLVVRAVHLEPDTAVDDALLAGLAGALRDLARFLGVPEIMVERSEPADLAPALRVRIRPSGPVTPAADRGG